MEYLLLVSELVLPWIAAGFGEDDFDLGAFRWCWGYWFGRGSGGMLLLILLMILRARLHRDGNPGQLH